MPREASSCRGIDSQPTSRGHLDHFWASVYQYTHELKLKVERDSRKLIMLLEQDGWFRVAVKGSHWQFKHPTKRGRVTVPHPDRDLKRGTVVSIHRQAGWK